MEKNEELELDTEETSEEDSTDWKEEAIKLRAEKGIIQRERTKALKALEELKSQAQKEPTPQDKLDYGTKAYLLANGIKNGEMDFFEQHLKESKMTPEQLLSNKHFLSALEERRGGEEVRDAIPEGTKRSNSSARNSVDYWLKKDALPPIDQPDLRREVVNARLKSEASVSKFSSNPVIK